MDYNKTFETRGNAYRYAVYTYPKALENEFTTAVNELSLSSSDILLNIPASCIELKQYFTTSPKIYYEFETNPTFAKLTNTQVCNFFTVPLPDKSVTKIISLASLHHMTIEERPVFYRECKRILQPEGLLLIGDVKKGSQQDKWLNEFVNKYNSQGHNGLFWNEDDCQLLQQQGYTTHMTEKDYMWNFTSKEELIDFTKHLFGLDLATDEQIWQGIQEYLTLNQETFELSWKLVYLHATLRP
jgi:SAM-dependent methyltransferase